MTSSTIYSGIVTQNSIYSAEAHSLKMSFMSSLLDIKMKSDGVMST